MGKGGCGMSALNALTPEVLLIGGMLEILGSAEREFRRSARTVEHGVGAAHRSGAGAASALFGGFGLFGLPAAKKSLFNPFGLPDPLGLAALAETMTITAGAIMKDSENKAVESAIAKDPSNPDLYLARGCVQLCKKQYDAAIESFGLATGLSGGINAASNYYTGLALHELKRDEDALACLGLSIEQWGQEGLKPTPAASEVKTEATAGTTTATPTTPSAAAGATVSVTVTATGGAEAPAETKAPTPSLAAAAGAKKASAARGAVLHSDPYSVKGAIHLSRSEYEEAHATLSQGITQFADDLKERLALPPSKDDAAKDKSYQAKKGDLYFNRALARFFLKNPQGAAEDLKQAEEANHKDQAGLFCLQFGAYTRLNDTDAASLAVGKAIAINPQIFERPDVASVFKALEFTAPGGGDAAPAPSAADSSSSSSSSSSSPSAAVAVELAI